MPGIEDAAIQAAETLQAAHLVKRPSVDHDAAPPTAAEGREPVKVDDTPPLDEASEVDEDEIPVSILRPAPRKPQMPPLPDLRFEQSYLASIKDAKGWHWVAFITIFMPLAQGMIWTLAVAGWRYWNATSSFKGTTVGARLRRWWWGVNGWRLPRASGKKGGMLRDTNLAEGMRDFYEGIAGNAEGD